MTWRTWNPEVLLLARATRQRTQQQVADTLDVSPGLLWKWESGGIQPPAERVEQLAAYLHYPSSLFYYSEQLRGTDSVCLYHRKRKTMPRRALDAAEAEMFFAQVHTSLLLRDLLLDTDREFVTLDPDEFGSPQAVARHLRALWRIPTGPIPNMVCLVESAGAVVLLREMRSRKLDGMSSWGKHAPPIFLLNVDNSVDRTRWTIAHELGHLTMHATPTSDPENEANAFAQEFLTPEDEIRPHLGNLSFANLPSLKAIWRVSMKALIMTAGKLGTLPPNKVKSLFVQYSRAGYNRGEPYPLSAEEPTVIPDAIRVHLDDHGFTLSEIASRIRLLPDEFTEKWASGLSGNDERHLRVV